MRVDCIQRFTLDIRSFFQRAKQVCSYDPALRLFVLQSLWRQRRADRIRRDWMKRGVRVPPFLVFSITRRTNLQGGECDVRELPRTTEPEMDTTELRRAIAEASKIGVSIILIAGGEPLLRPEILDITAEFPDAIFPLLTNGLLLDEEMQHYLKQQKNVVPIIDLRGYQPGVGKECGQEVYEQARERMYAMVGRGLFFGTSLMLTRHSFNALMRESFVQDLVEAGSRLFFFVEHLPLGQEAEDLSLTSQQRHVRGARVAAFHTRLPALFVTFPGETSSYGGCLAAGRGFLHVSPEGHVEPCPYSPFSDASLKEMSLVEALQSSFLRRIREQEEHLRSSPGECALWANREWVRSLL